MSRLNFHEIMRVDLPEIDADGVRVRKFEVGKPTVNDRLRALSDGGRGITSPGTYTRLDIDGRLWMSDTDDERRDHLEPLWQAEKHGGRVLVHGLGLGMVIGALLRIPNVEHVDVVEIDQRIIEHVGPHYAGPRCTIHHGDALTHPWPKDARWTVAWHDIWKDITAENLPEMHRLHRRFGRRTEWQGSWARWRAERGR